MDSFKLTNQTIWLKPLRAQNL